MKALYVFSTTPFSGKTALCVGLGERLIKDGFSVGYMKPISTTAKRIAGRVVDEDAQFIKQALDLSEPLDLISPLTLMPEVIEDILKGKKEIDFSAKLKGAYDEVVRGKDLVILEGGASLIEGAIIGLSARLVAQMLDARVLVITKYTSDLIVDEILEAREVFDGSIIGVVINSVPPQRLQFVDDVIRSYLRGRGIEVFAVLPQDRLLMSISVGQLVDCLGGQVLCCPEACDELVEHLMVGAMNVESALSYFRRKPNKAVITGGDRPDIQLAALQTSTKCLILTGNLYPSSIILERAEEVGVPVVLVKQDTFTAVEIIGKFFGKTRLHEKAKVDRLKKMLEERFDFDALYLHLGLKSS